MLLPHLDSWPGLMMASLAAIDYSNAHYLNSYRKLLLYVFLAMGDTVSLSDFSLPCLSTMPPTEIRLAELLKKLASSPIPQLSSSWPQTSLMRLQYALILSARARPATSFSLPFLRLPMLTLSPLRKCSRFFCLSTRTMSPMSQKVPLEQLSRILAEEIQVGGSNTKFTGRMAMPVYSWSSTGSMHRPGIVLLIYSKGLKQVLIFLYSRNDRERSIFWQIWSRISSRAGSPTSSIFIATLSPVESNTWSSWTVMGWLAQSRGCTQMMLWSRVSMQASTSRASWGLSSALKWAWQQQQLGLALMRRMFVRSCIAIGDCSILQTIIFYFQTNYDYNFRPFRNSTLLTLIFSTMDQHDPRVPGFFPSVNGYPILLELFPIIAGTKFKEQQRILPISWPNCPLISDEAIPDFNCPCSYGPMRNYYFAISIFLYF